MHSLTFLWCCGNGQAIALSLGGTEECAGAQATHAQRTNIGDGEREGSGEGAAALGLRAVARGVVQSGYKTGGV